MTNCILTSTTAKIMPNHEKPAQFEPFLPAYFKLFMESENTNLHDHHISFLSPRNNTGNDKKLSSLKPLNFNFVTDNDIR